MASQCQALAPGIRPELLADRAPTRAGETPALRKPRPRGMISMDTNGSPPLASFEIQGALFLEALQIAEDILLDFLRRRFRIQFLQVRDDLLHGVISVAALDDFQARAVEPQRAFRHQEHARRLRLFIEAAARREARALGWIGRHADSFAGQNAPGGGQPGSTYAK